MGLFGSKKKNLDSEIPEIVTLAAQDGTISDSEIELLTSYAEKENYDAEQLIGLAKMEANRIQQSLKKNMGYVYILTNDAFKDDWIKIGMTSKEVDLRSKQLDNTAVPLPFKMYATCKTLKFKELEKFIHRNLEDLRIRENREFFNVNPDKVLQIFKDFKDLFDPTAEITPYYDLPDSEIVDEVAKKKGERFKFPMIGLTIGTELYYDNNPNIKVRIVTDTKVEYKGEKYNLGGVAKLIDGNKKKRYDGYKLFYYNGKSLKELRKEFNV